MAFLLASLFLERFGANLKYFAKSPKPVKTYRTEVGILTFYWRVVLRMHALYFNSGEPLYVNLKINAVT